MKFRVMEYDSDGSDSLGMLDEKVESLASARNVVREHLGVQNLRARVWSPPDEGDPIGWTTVEGYHNYPVTHRDAFGCGGLCILKSDA